MVLSTDTAERTRIARKAQDLFFAGGITRVTTDQVARELGISKKTLYQHFQSKEELLAAAVLLMREEMRTALHSIVADRSLDFVGKLHAVLLEVGGRLSRIQPPFFEELPRKAPKIWHDLEEFRRDVVFHELGRLVAQGVRRRMIRRDVDPQLFLQMFLATIRGIIHPEGLAHLSHSAGDVFRTILTIYLQGVLTDEARSSFISQKQ